MKKVLLLLADGFEIYEASAFIDVIGWNFIEGDAQTQLYSASVKKEITSSFGQRFVCDYTLNEIKTNDFDALAIPGGFEEFGFYNDAFCEDFQNLIRDFYLSGKPIASICVASLAIAKSGILNNKVATTYNKNPQRIAQLQEYGAKYIDQPIVLTENIITSQNPATAMEVALLLLKVITNEENMLKVKLLMGF